MLVLIHERVIHAFWIGQLLTKEHQILIPKQGIIRHVCSRAGRISRFGDSVPVNLLQGFLCCNCDLVPEPLSCGFVKGNN